MGAVAQIRICLHRFRESPRWTLVRERKTPPDARMGATVLAVVLIGQVDGLRGQASTHNPSTMRAYKNALDVSASMARWLRITFRGRLPWLMRTWSSGWMTSVIGSRTT